MIIKPASHSRRHFSQTLGMGVLAAPFIARSAHAAGRAVKIGFVSPQTGPLAAFAEADSYVLSQAKTVIGAGLLIGGQCHPVQLLYRDSQSDPSRATQIAADLIANENVDLLLASSASNTTAPVADQAEANGVPCITTDTPWQAWFFGRHGVPGKGFQWTYHFFWGANDAINAYADMWNHLSTNRRVGALWSNDPDGQAFGDPNRGLPPALRQLGYDVVDLGLFPPLSADFSAQISKLKASNVDILTGVFLPPDFATFWIRAAQLEFQPKIATPAKAILFPAAVTALGARGLGLSSELWWSPRHPFTSGLTGQSAAAFATGYTAATGREWIQPMGFKHALIEVACDVLRRTTNVDDPASIRDAIATTDYASIVGRVNWKNGPMNNVSSTPLVGGQWQKGTNFPAEIFAVANKFAPQIPVSRTFEPLAV